MPEFCRFHDQIYTYSYSGSHTSMLHIIYKLKFLDFWISCHNLNNDDFLNRFLLYCFVLSEVFARNKCNYINIHLCRELIKIIFTFRNAGFITFRNAGFIIQRFCCNNLDLQANYRSNWILYKISVRYKTVYTMVHE